MAPESYLSIVFACVTLGVAFWLLWWQSQKAVAVTEAWAKANGYTIMHREWRMFRQGPFFVPRWP